MKKVLTALGMVFLILILIGATLIGYLVYNGNKLDASSKAYVDENVPAIVSTWSKDELIKRASPQLRSKFSNTQLNQVFILFRKLGSFQSYDGAKGEADLGFTSKTGAIVTASYTANVTFQNGKATIQIKLIRSNNSWRIAVFDVDSPLFK